MQFHQAQVETHVTEKINIFEFSDYADFLNRYVTRFGRYGHGPYNLKNWANRLGYRSASSLTMILNKSRLPTYKMIHAFSEDFRFNKNEKKYFELLVELERNKKTGQSCVELIEEIKKISGFSEYQKINIDQFVIVSEWYCYVIKALVTLNNFKLDIDWIFEALRKKVTKTQIKSAIEALENVGMLKFDTHRGFFDGAPKTHTGNEVPSSAIRQHHQGMLKRGMEALDEQTIEERFFQSMTLCFDKELDYQNATDDIQKFVNTFNRKYSKNQNANAVYQLNLQFFQHSKDMEQKVQ